MSKSLISNEKECLVCKTTFGIHKHHIFFGVANRKKSEADGAWCYLCARHHNMSNQGVHFNKKLDLKLKRLCQSKWEQDYRRKNMRIDGAREAFIDRFGKNYL